EYGGGDLEAKIDMLLYVEKQMRQVGDVAGTRKAVTPLAIILLIPQTIPLNFSLQESQSRRRRDAAVQSSHRQNTLTQPHHQTISLLLCSLLRGKSLKKAGEVHGGMADSR
ncbi:UNVERIFIED_CONTAM: hypothetical protein Sindi_1431500, partial [Sesamum indicum]